MNETTIAGADVGDRAGPVATTGPNSTISRLANALISGALLSFAYPHADIGWFAFFALIPFLRTFPYQRSGSAFGYGFLFGLTYFTCLLYWIAVFAETKIGAFGIGAWLILSGRESLYIGLFSAGLNFLWGRTNWFGRAIGAASLWTAIEWIRQLGSLGFGWGDLAYTQWRFLPLIQIASVTGLWGVTWLIVLVNTAFASARPKIIGWALSLTLIVAIGGALRMHFADQPHTVASAAALQADISEDVPYSGLRPSSSAYFYGTLGQFDQMAADAKQRTGATICVTAETSIPGYPNLDPPLKQLLISIAQKHNITLIAGARDSDVRSQMDTNSVFVFHPDGSISGPYDKQQLVPFGEYVPLRNVFPFLNSFHVLDFDMHAGSSNQPPLDAGNGDKAGIAICYESTYPRYLREQAARGATFDVVVTDDTWYGKTAAAKQHEAMSVMRAVETNRYLVRCATTGISAVISPMGKVLASAPIFKRAVVTAPIEQRHDLTPFVRYGDWFPWVCVAGLSVQFIFVSRTATNRVRSGDENAE
jgi:apolipoprotein N-acyltransferase